MASIVCQRLFRGRHTKRTELVVALCTIIVFVYLLVRQRDVDKGFICTAADVSCSRIKFTGKIRTSLVTAIVDEKFISVCIPWRSIVGWNFSPAAEKQIIALSKALSPAYARIGGTAGDFVILTDQDKKPEHFRRRTTVDINGKDLDRINQIAENAGWQVLFTLSVLRRSANGSWDPSNPLRIVKYAADNGYKFGWELGNEPNRYMKKHFDVDISPEQLAEDFKTLRTHLSTFPGVENFLVGPDVTQPGGHSTEYLKRYYMKALHSSLPQFFEPQVLDSLNQDITRADEAINEVAPNLPKWLGETANVAGGGAKGLSDRFVSGFLWLNKLGMAAQHGYKVVIRQSMFKGGYSLVGKDLEPNPDYWLSVLHKRLFGTRVLGVDRGNYRPDVVRIFAHCTKTKSGLYKQGAVSFMAMNLHSNKSVDIQLAQNLQEFGVDEYLFSPEGCITSRKVRLNGKLLEVGANSTFPVFHPNPIPPGDHLILPPLTYAFYVVPEANAPACLESSSDFPDASHFNIPY